MSGQGFTLSALRLGLVRRQIEEVETSLLKNLALSNNTREGRFGESPEERQSGVDFMGPIVDADLEQWMDLLEQEQRISKALKFNSKE